MTTSRIWAHRDESYDCVVISRVLAIPRDLDSSVRELRRILKQGGIAVIAENCAREKTEEFGKTINDRARIIGMDILELYRETLRPGRCISVRSLRR